MITGSFKSIKDIENLLEVYLQYLTIKVSLMKLQSSDQCVGCKISGLQHNCEGLKRMKG